MKHIKQFESFNKMLNEQIIGGNPFDELIKRGGEIMKKLPLPAPTNMKIPTSKTGALKMLIEMIRDGKTDFFETIAENIGISIPELSKDKCDDILNEINTIDRQGGTDQVKTEKLFKFLQQNYPTDFSDISKLLEVILGQGTR